MLGVFDSGAGGLISCAELHRLLPREDVIFLADRANSPYGTKSASEILALTENAVSLLLKMGAQRVLIACCTASSVREELPSALREKTVSVIPRAAKIAADHSERITVIGTEHTVRCGCFTKAITEENPHCRVHGIPAQELVQRIENGARDGRVTADCAAYLDSLCGIIRKAHTDTLILGCTHFSHLEGELGSRLAGMRLISPAREGAAELATLSANQGSGRLIHLKTKRKHSA